MAQTISILTVIFYLEQLCDVVTKQPLRVNVHIKTTLRERFDDYFRIFFQIGLGVLLDELTSEERETKKERQKERDKKRETKKERQKLLPIHYESIQQCLHIFLSSTVTSFTIEENTTKFLIN